MNETCDRCGPAVRAAKPPAAQAPPPSAPAPLARWIRRSAVILLTLAAPAVAISGELTTGLHDTAPAVGFPHGYRVTLAATVAAATQAAVLAALIARRDALMAIPVSLGIWAVIGLDVVAARIQLGHTGLPHWGIILVAASLIGAAAGMLLAAHHGQPGRRNRRPAAIRPGRPATTVSGQAHTPARRTIRSSAASSTRAAGPRTSQPGPAAESAQRRRGTRLPAPIPNFPSGPAAGRGGVRIRRAPAGLVP
jgi:hypothetical protein